MNENLFVVHIERTKIYNKMTKNMVIEHVNNIKKLDDEGKLELCGVFKGYPGIAGMYIIKAKDIKKAHEICKMEPLVILGYATYKVYEFKKATRENNYLI